jgi:vacuolar iron transporter family protein
LAAASLRYSEIAWLVVRPVPRSVDGLVTNASLISGLGGGGVSAHTVVLTGVASLVAGAFSMGTGEFISVTNQNELAGYFRDYGADPQTAARMAAAVSRDPDTALQIHSRQELGVNPQELPSPLLAGVSSLFAFSAGAVVPLLRQRRLRRRNTPGRLASGCRMTTVH